MKKLEEELEESGNELKELRDFLVANPLNFTKNAELADVLAIHVDLLDQIQDLHLKEIGG